MPSYVIDNGVLVKPYVLPLPEEIQRDMEVYFFGDGECLNQLKKFHPNNIADVEVNFHGMVNDR
jgi:hypothetical protein